MLFWLVVAACKSDPPKIVVLQPFSGFPRAVAERLRDHLAAHHETVVLEKSLSFPADAFYRPRNRYRADVLLNFLGVRVAGNTVIVGLSDKDISATSGKIYDWGVMGFGRQPGNACVVATFRLRKKNFEEQLYKLTLHELGHTAGLPHCEEQSCLMRDAEGKNPIDQETGFCADCRTYLLNQGWKL